jgi:hypothetical protein
MDETGSIKLSVGMLVTVYLSKFLDKYGQLNERGL